MKVIIQLTSIFAGGCVYLFSNMLAGDYSETKKRDDISTNCIM